MYEEQVYSTFYRVFDSVEDLVETVSKMPCDPRVVTWKNADKVGRAFGDWSDVYAAARAPWPEGEAIVRQMVAELEGSDLPKPESRRRKMRFDETDGDEFDYDRSRTGQPYWRTSRRKSQRGPQTVTIVIDVNAKIAIDHTDILWKGAAAIAMTHILEEAGYRVELWIVHKATEAYTNDDGHVTALCLKRPSEPLDMATFSAAASGWFYRSVMFRAKSRRDRKCRASLGHPCAPWSNDLEHLFPGREVVLISGTYSRSGAMYVAREALKKIATPPAPPPVEPDVEPVAVATKSSEPAPQYKAPTKKEIAESNRRWKQYMKAHAEN